MPYHSLSLRWQRGLRKSRSTLLPAAAILVATFLSACNGSAPSTRQPNENALATTVAHATGANLTQEADSPTPAPTQIAPASPAATWTPEASGTPTPSATLPDHNVTGRICFPGGEIPAMTAYFEETETETITELAVAQGQASYEANLAPGRYIAYAWLLDFSWGGLYSRAVSCGMSADCNDHGLEPFHLKAGELLSGIDLCDWQPGPFNVPYPPGKSKSEITGNITGELSYFGGSAPGLRVVAYNLDTSYWYWVSTLPEQTSFIIAELPAGAYHLVAYDAEGSAGGHADADHSLIPITVKAGETTSGADIADWNAPSGSFPEDPTR